MMLSPPTVNFVFHVWQKSECPPQVTKKSAHAPLRFYLPLPLLLDTPSLVNKSVSAELRTFIRLVYRNFVDQVYEIKWTLSDGVVRVVCLLSIVHIIIVSIILYIHSFIHLSINSFIHIIHLDVSIVPGKCTVAMDRLCL